MADKCSIESSKDICKLANEKMQLNINYLSPLIPYQTRSQSKLELSKLVQHLLPLWQQE
jgi:hypothetical protein